MPHAWAAEPTLSEVQVHAPAWDAPSITTTYERSELLEKGDASLQEVLRRLPGVSVDSEGNIALRGMGQGRTQVVIDDQPLITSSGDVSVKNIPLSLVERITIVRGATAQDTGGAVAGSIRITTRRANATPERTARLRLGFTPGGQFEHHASVNLGGAQAQWQWQLSAEVSQKEEQPRRTTLTQTGGYRSLIGGDGTHYYFPIQETHLQQTQEAYRLRQASLSGEVALQATAHDRVSLRWKAQIEPEDLQGAEVRDLQQITPSNIHHNASMGSVSENSSPNWHLSPTLAWRHTLDQGGYVQAELGWQRSQSIDRYTATWNHFAYNTSTTEGRYTQDQHNTERSELQDRNNHAALQWLQPLGGGHSLQLGTRWHKERFNAAISNYEYEFWQDYGDTNAKPDAWDDEWSESSTRTTQANFAQWNWQPQTAWSLQAGLRHERQVHQAPDDEGDTQRRSNDMWLPSFSASFNPSHGPRWHLNIAKTYRAPALENMQDYLRRRSGDIQNPDLMGNPYLRNEVSTGLELGVSQSLQRSGRTVGQWHANMFARRIKDSQTQEISSYNSWGQERWLLTPVNLGTTHVKGIETGIRYDLPKLPLTLHADMVLTQSRVAGQAAPERLNGQTPLQLNVGWDARTSGNALLPDQWGGQLRYEAGYDTRLNPNLPATVNAMTSWHLHAMWKLSDDMRLRTQFTHGSDWRSTAYLSHGADEYTHIHMTAQRPWQAAVQLEHDF